RFARGAQAAEDRRRIGAVEDHEAQHVLRGKPGAALVVGGREPRGNERHRPGLGPREPGIADLIGKQRCAVRDVAQPRRVLSPLDVARHPVQLVRGPAQHRYSASTQVSFVPPPCDEFTTSDPSRNATRVSPPGTISTSLPDSTYGRKSMCRGANPDVA